MQKTTNLELYPGYVRKACGCITGCAYIFDVSSDSRLFPFWNFDSLVVTIKAAYLSASGITKRVVLIDTSFGQEKSLNSIKVFFKENIKDNNV